MGEHTVSEPAAVARFPWWPLVVALCVVSGVVLGLYGLTPVSQRADMLRSVGGTLTGLVAAVTAGLSAWLTHRLRGTTDAQSSTLATIQKQTNGVLDKRIADGVAAALDKAGLIPAPLPAGYDRPAPRPPFTPPAVESGEG